MESKYILQGTLEWETARLMRITSSEAFKLMAKSENGSLLSVGAITYADEILDEIITGQSKTFTNKFVEYGKSAEERARLEIEKKYGIDTMICGFITHPDLPFYGGSLDSVIIIDGVKYAIEIKCPFYPVEHRKNIKFSTTPELFKQKHPNYYWQCQSNIVIGQCDKALFVTYNPFFKNPISCHTIERNEMDINAMLNKIKTAWQYIEMEAEAYEVEIPSYLKPTSILFAEKKDGVTLITKG